MAVDIVDEEEAPRPNTSKRVPWNARGSLWQSSFGCPLAHTSLRAYLSPQKKKTLMEGMPHEALERQYYNESIKFSYIQGLFDSEHIHSHVQQHRRCIPQPDNVTAVLNMQGDFEPDASRHVRKKVVGSRCTGSSVENCIIQHPVGDPQLPGTPTVIQGRFRVSGKIGSRPGRSDKVAALGDRCRTPADFSGIAFQKALDTIKPAPTSLVDPDILEVPSPHPARPSSRSLPSKPARSLRSRIVPLSVAASVPLARLKEKVVKSPCLPRSAEDAVSAAIGPSSRQPVAPRTEAVTQQTAPPSLAAAIKVARLQVQLQQLTTLALSKTEARVENSAPATPREQTTPQRRKGKEVAYMPLAAMKPKLMDHVEKTLFGRGMKALALNGSRRSDCTDAS